MTYAEYTRAQPDAGPDEAARIELPEYVLVFRDDQPPKEHEFVAISDAAAAEMMDKQYPRFAWALYHVEGGQRRCVHTHPDPSAPGLGDGAHGRPHPGPAASAPQNKARGLHEE